MSLKTISANLREESLRQAPYSQKSELGGVSYSPEPFDALCRAIGRWFQGDLSQTFVAGYVNPHVFNLAMKNTGVLRFLSISDLVAVDGLGVALAIRWFKGHRQTRTVMTPLFDWALAQSEFPKLPAVLIGGNADVLLMGSEAINKASGNLRVENTCSGYESPERQMEFLSENPEAKVVLVAMGSPRSEELILAAIDTHPGKFYWNIGGGTLHFYAGTQPRVPAIVSRAGLQWAWRIIHEPSIAPRYFIGIPLFLKHLLGILLTRKQSSHHRT